MKEQAARKILQLGLQLDDEKLGSELAEYLKSPKERCDFCGGPIYSSFLEKVELEALVNPYNEDDVMVVAWKGLFCRKHVELDGYFANKKKEK